MCFVASCRSLQSTACSRVFADHRGSLLPPASPLMVSIGVGKYFHWVFSVTGVGRWTVAGLPWLPPCAGIRASSTSTLWHLIPSSSIGDEFNVWIELFFYTVPDTCCTSIPQNLTALTVLTFQVLTHCKYHKNCNTETHYQELIQDIAWANKFTNKRSHFLCCLSLKCSFFSLWSRCFFFKECFKSENFSCNERTM